MKTKISLLVLLLCFSLHAKTITIKGHITGRLPETLSYTAPVNGSQGFIMYYTAIPDSKGNFEIKTDIAETTFIDLFYNFQTAGYIVATPGGQYSVEITETGGKVTYNVTGTNAELQKYYNQLVANTHREMPFYALSLEASNIEGMREFEDYFNRKYEADIQDISGLENSKAITHDIANALVNERKYYYGAAKSYAILMKHGNAERQAIPTDLSAFDASLKALYQTLDPASPDVQKAPCGGLYLEFYKSYKWYESVGFDGKKFTPNHDELANAKRNTAFMPKQNAEFYLALTLYNMTVGAQKQKHTLDVFSYFKEQYPNSGYTPYLQDAVAPVAAFFAAGDSLPQGAAYVEGYATINSFEELVKRFSGQKLYFDVWATTCSPCRQEFKHKDALYKKLKENNIAVVYISIDEDDKDETWKKMIGHYGLTGYHIRANKTLDAQLRKMFSGNTSVSIPWYILVGANGTIATKYAAPPSEMNTLENQLKQL